MNERCYGVLISNMNPYFSYKTSARFSMTLRRAILSSRFKTLKSLEKIKKRNALSNLFTVL